MPGHGLAHNAQPDKSIFSMISLLNDGNSIVRHTARKWLFGIRNGIEAVFDPILEVLLHPYTCRERKGGLYIYLQEFQIRKTQEALKRLTEVVEYRPEITESMRVTSVSPAIEKLLPVHNLSTGTYLEVILDIVLLYLNSISAYQCADNKMVQAGVCELLQTFVHNLPHELALKALNGCVESLFRAVLNEDGAASVLIQKVIRNILFLTDLTEHPGEFSPFLLSKDIKIIVNI